MLNEIIFNKDTNIKTASCHPGGVNTELSSNFLDNPVKRFLNWAAWPLRRYCMKTAN